MPPAAPRTNRAAAYQTNGPLLPSRATIYVNIYRLFPQSKYLEPIGWGIHHSGVEVFGVEHGYGRGPEGTGMFQVAPRSYGVGECTETVEVGETLLTEREVELVLEELEKIAFPPMPLAPKVARAPIGSPNGSTQPLVSSPASSQDVGVYPTQSPPPPGQQASAKGTSGPNNRVGNREPLDLLAKHRRRHHHHLVWQGPAYHLMLHNCNCFSEVLVEMLLTFVPYSDRVVPIVVSAGPSSPGRATSSPTRHGGGSPPPPGVGMAAFAPVTPIREDSPSDLLPSPNGSPARQQFPQQATSTAANQSAVPKLGTYASISDSSASSGSYADIVLFGAGDSILGMSNGASRAGAAIGLHDRNFGREAADAAQLAAEDRRMREHIHGQIITFMPKKDRLRARNCCCGTCSSCCPPCFAHCCCGCCCPRLCWGTCDSCCQEEYWYTSDKAHRLPAERFRLERMLDGNCYSNSGSQHSAKSGNRNGVSSYSHEGYQFRPFPMNVNRVSNIGAFLLPACLIKRIDDVDVNMQTQMLDQMTMPAPANIME